MSLSSDPYEQVSTPSHVDLLVPQLRQVLEDDADVASCLSGGVHRVPNPLVVPEAAVPFLTIFAQGEGGTKQANNELEIKLEVVVGIFTHDDRTTIEDDERTVATLINAIRSALLGNEFVEDGVGNCFAEGIEETGSIPYGQFTQQDELAGEYHVFVATYRYRINAKTGVIQ